MYPVQFSLRHPPSEGNAFAPRPQLTNPNSAAFQELAEATKPKAKAPRKHTLKTLMASSSGSPKADKGPQQVVSRKKKIVPVVPIIPERGPFSRPPWKNRAVTEPWSPMRESVVSAIPSPLFSTTEDKPGDDKNKQAHDSKQSPNNPQTPPAIKSKAAAILGVQQAPVQDANAIEGPPKNVVTPLAMLRASAEAGPSPQLVDDDRQTKSLPPAPTSRFYMENKKSGGRYASSETNAADTDSVHSGHEGMILSDGNIMATNDGKYGTKGTLQVVNKDDAPRVPSHHAKVESTDASINTEDAEHGERLIQDSNYSPSEYTSRLSGGPDSATFPVTGYERPPGATAPEPLIINSNRVDEGSSSPPEADIPIMFRGSLDEIGGPSGLQYVLNNGNNGVPLTPGYGSGALGMHHEAFSNTSIPMANPPLPHGVDPERDPFQILSAQLGSLHYHVDEVAGRIDRRMQQSKDEITDTFVRHMERLMRMCEGSSMDMRHGFTHAETHLEALRNEHAMFSDRLGAATRDGKRVVPNAGKPHGAEIAAALDRLLEGNERLVNVVGSMSDRLREVENNVFLRQLGNIKFDDRVDGDPIEEKIRRVEMATAMVSASGKEQVCEGSPTKDPAARKKNKKQQKRRNSKEKESVASGEDGAHVKATTTNDSGATAVATPQLAQASTNAPTENSDVPPTTPKLSLATSDSPIVDEKTAGKAKPDSKKLQDGYMRAYSKQRGSVYIPGPANPSPELARHPALQGVPEGDEEVGDGSPKKAGRGRGNQRAYQHYTRRGSGGSMKIGAVAGPSGYQSTSFAPLTPHRKNHGGGDGGGYGGGIQQYPAGGHRNSITQGRRGNPLQYHQHQQQQSITSPPLMMSPASADPQMMGTYGQYSPHTMGVDYSVPEQMSSHYGYHHQYSGYNIPVSMGGAVGPMDYSQQHAQNAQRQGHDHGHDQMSMTGMSSADSAQQGLGNGGWYRQAFPRGQTEQVVYGQPGQGGGQRQGQGSRHGQGQGQGQDLSG